MTKINKILSKLIECESVTPHDDGCQNYIGTFLSNIGFKIEKHKYNDVENIIASKGTNGPVLAFVGHTDVVPTGKLEKWSTNPFSLTERNGNLYGRGTADMKGSIACMMLAISNFLETHTDHDGTIMIILTSDEEGPATYGIQKLIENNDIKNNDIDMCIVGEPSSKKKLGDTVKNGRRGSLSGRIIIKGIQGHIAYPQNASNPIHMSAPIIAELINEKYDNGNDYFPPTSFQISNVNSGVGATNIIPGELILDFNFRYSTETTMEQLKATVEKILNSSNVEYNIDWNHSGEPFLTKKGKLLDICVEAISEVTSLKPVISTDGGTSDGRFMAKVCKQVVELGLINESIHKIDEHTTQNDLDTLVVIYQRILKKILI